jgi:hypothetical protein
MQTADTPYERYMIPRLQALLDEVRQVNRRVMVIFRPTLSTRTEPRNHGRAASGSRMQNIDGVVDL